MKRSIAASFCLAFAGLASAAGPADTLIAGGVRYLRTAVEKENRIGELALGTLALLKSGERTSDPVIKTAIEKLRSRASAGFYKPDRSGGPDNYEAGLVAMALVAADGSQYLPEITAVAEWIMNNQTEMGAWDYAGGRTGDTSMTQYAVLGLWEAASVGVEVPLDVWDRAMFWLITRQDSDGGFAYHPEAPDPEGRPRKQQVTHTMGAGGAATMLICRSQLPFPKRKTRAGADSELLIPVEKENRGDYKPVVSAVMADEAVDRADRWMSSNMTVDNPSGIGGHCYFLYAVERYAELAGLKTIGRSAWYEEGLDYLKDRQKPDGSWQERYEGIVDTSFAVLFLGRSTRKTLTRIQISLLSKGTMLGGRGLPDPNGPPTELQARQKARYRHALKASVEDLLAILENPESTGVEEASVAIETARPEKILAAIKGDLSKLRLLTRSPRVAVRVGAMWALARTRDYRAAPILVAGLSDPDPEVYKAARGALELLSRRIDAFGLPADPEKTGERKAGIERAKQWVEQLNLEVSPEQEFDD